MRYAKSASTAILALLCRSQRFIILRLRRVRSIVACRVDDCVVMRRECRLLRGTQIRKKFDFGLLQNFVRFAEKVKPNLTSLKILCQKSFMYRNLAYQIANASSSRLYSRHVLPTSRSQTSKIFKREVQLSFISRAMLRLARSSLSVP